MCVKLPRNAELLAEPGGQRLHADRFGGVVPGIDRVHAELHRVEIAVMGAFPGEEAVQTHGVGRADPVAGSARDDSDPVRELGSTGNQPGPDAQQVLDASDQRCARLRRIQDSPYPDGHAAVAIEGLDLSQTELSRQDRLI